MRKKWVILFLCSILVLTGCSGNIEQQIAEQLTLGEKYLSEMSYDEAIVAFQKAIELEPKCTEAYIGLAQVYQSMGELEQALNVLLKVPTDAIGLDEVEEMRNEIEKELEMRKENEKKKAEIEKIKQEHYVPEFNQRSNYIEFSEIEEEKKNWLEKMVQAVVNEDWEKIKSLSTAAGNEGFSLCTEYDNTRLQIGYEENDCWIQVRTENGMGYYYYYTKESSALDMPLYKYKKCPCSNWQYNGMMEGYSEIGEYQLYESAEYENGLLQGIHEEDVLTGQEGIDGFWISHYRTLYEDSKWVADLDENGNSISEGVTNLYPYTIGIMMSPVESISEYDWSIIYW